MMWTADLDATIAFYVEVLGFACREKNDEWGWASLGRDDVWILLARPNEHTRFDKIGFTGSFYFTTDDADELWEELKDKARVCYGIENFEWGMREFAVYDNNGYLLQFGQEISS
jgi:catechol 2,3-dioxygenase-like lactoylglutathione lyase family enzyme